jgi:VanZ family protein
VSTRSRVIVAWTPALLYMLLIWWLSSRAVYFPSDLFPFRDKGVHVVEYGVLGALFAQALLGTFLGLSRLQLWVWAIGLTVLWGMIDEIHQGLVPGRNADIYDVVADSIGAVLGATVRLFVLSRWAMFKRGEVDR